MSDYALFGSHVQHRHDRLGHLLNELGYDVVLIHSGRVDYPRFDDRAQPFRAHGHFIAWLPLTDAPDCVLELSSGQRPILWYLQADDFWHIPPQSPEAGWADHFDVRPINDARHWKERFKQTGAIAAIGDERHLAGLGDHVAINPPDLLQALDEDRTYKTPWECQCIMTATQRAARAHMAAYDAFMDKGSELDIFYAYMQALNEDPNRLPYDAIVALNEHAATLHYQHRQAHAPKHHLSFLLDAGADERGYASDITRTHLGPTQGEGSGVFQGLIDAMDHLERRLALSAVPGHSFVDLHNQAHRGIAEILCGAELVRGSPESVVDTGLTRRFFPHGLGHFLGVQVHDVAGQVDASGQALPPPPADPMLRLTRVLEVDQVLTIEPGLYFIPMLLDPLRETPEGRSIHWDLVDTLIPYGGVRIEDNVRVRDGQPVNFTREAFDDL